jgi:uncharacterized protein (TIGR00369 family)
MKEKKEFLESINSMSEFNKWCGIRVLSADEGVVELQIEWRNEMGQYSGFLHAGLIATLIDTACGFAAATMVGPKILASNFSVNCLRPATGDKFIARARVVKPGRQQIFTACELFSVNGSEEKLVANGETLLLVV